MPASAARAPGHRGDDAQGRGRGDPARLTQTSRADSLDGFARAARRDLAMAHGGFVLGLVPHGGTHVTPSTEQKASVLALALRLALGASGLLLPQAHLLRRRRIPARRVVKLTRCRACRLLHQPCKAVALSHRTRSARLENRNVTSLTGSAFHIHRFICTILCCRLLIIYVCPTTQKSRLLALQDRTIL